MHVETFDLDTQGRLVTDITSEVRDICGRAGGEGLANVFVPHATCGLALMETGSGSEADLEEAVSRLLPRDDRYTHAHGSMGHGGNHLLPALISPSLVLPVEQGRPVLGTWQSVVVVDPNSDNNRRHCRVTVIRG